MPIAAAATNSLKITEKKARGGNNKVDWFQLEMKMIYKLFQRAAACLTFFLSALGGILMRPDQWPARGCQDSLECQIVTVTQFTSPQVDNVTLEYPVDLCRKLMSILELYAWFQISLSQVLVKIATSVYLLSLPIIDYTEHILWSQTLVLHKISTTVHLETGGLWAMLY